MPARPARHAQPHTVWLVHGATQGLVTGRVYALQFVFLSFQPDAKSFGIA